MLFFLIIILLIISMIIIYFYYNNKLSITKQQLLRTSNQYNNLKSKYTNSMKTLNNVTIEFTPPNIKTAITKSNINLYVAPINDSVILRRLEVMMEVQILDKAITNNTTWLYVSLPLDTIYNCRGWIKASDFSNIATNKIVEKN